MKAFLSSVGGIILSLALAIGLILGCVYGYIALYGDAAPRMADAERRVFENTQSYLHGKITDLAKMRREYAASKDVAEKRAIKELALTTATNIDREKLPADIRRFLSSLESE